MRVRLLFFSVIGGFCFGAASKRLPADISLFSYLTSHPLCEGVGVSIVLRLKDENV